VFASLIPDQPEITDLIINHDPATLDRLPVRKHDVLAVFSKFQNQKALAAVLAIPERDGFLDPLAVDRLLLTIHWEMQRLAEEFFHGHRVRQLLDPLISALRAEGFRGPIRIVDVGTGIGYVIRWLAARTSLAAQGVELVGMDLNSTLVREASRLASAESLPCRFIQGDAFSREACAQIYLSTGVIHHFSGNALGDFLRRHNLPERTLLFTTTFIPGCLLHLDRGSSTFFVCALRSLAMMVCFLLPARTPQMCLPPPLAPRSQIFRPVFTAQISGVPPCRAFFTL